ncbi:MAG: GGDEF domain-containing protein [Myxococcales bacterium]|nr:GGDEF domain-containing protein [Myxococcales bacterium]
MLNSAPTSPGLVVSGNTYVPTPVVTMIEGEESSRAWILSEKPVVFGRALVCDIALADAKASRRHARVQWMNASTPAEAPEVWLEDLGSTNGSWVNGQRVEEPVRLCERDKVLIGSTLFGYSLRIKEEVAVQRRLVQRATTDPLTAMNNAEVFERALRREFERARRYARPLSLVYMNLDHLTRVNQDHGERIGDLVLRQIGRILRDNLRLCDMSARAGGDEFELLLPETGVEGALAVSERIRHAVEEFPMMLGADPIKVTTSMGVATIDGTFSSADAFVDAARQATLRAKEQGRNRTALHLLG